MRALKMLFGQGDEGEQLMVTKAAHQYSMSFHHYLRSEDVHYAQFEPKKRQNYVLLSMTANKLLKLRLNEN